MVYLNKEHGVFIHFYEGINLDLIFEMTPTTYKTKQSRKNNVESSIVNLLLRTYLLIRIAEIFK